MTRQSPIKVHGSLHTIVHLSDSALDRALCMRTGVMGMSAVELVTVSKRESGKVQRKGMDIN